MVPLGKDMHSKLWEFWHVGTGVKPDWESTEHEQHLGRVVLKAGEEASESELISFVRERTTPFKAPAKVLFRQEELPKSGVGKILRRVLRDEAAGSTG